MKTQSHTKVQLFAIALMAGALGFAQAQTRSEEAILLDEALEALKEQKAETARVDAENLRLRKQVKTIGASLVEANRVANEFRDDYNKLRLETEALGLETLTKGDQGTRERLLKAISDRRIIEQEREAMADALLELSDSIKAYMTTAVSANVETRAALQAALKQAGRAIGIDRKRPGERRKKELDEGKIVSIHRDSGTLILNLGEGDDAQIGMPLEIFRKDRQVGTGIISDTREDVCSVLVLTLIDESDLVKVGDRVKVQTQKNL